MSEPFDLDPNIIEIKFFGLKTIDDLSILLNVTSKELKYHLYAVSSSKKYRTFYIRKKSGSSRKISAPATALKIIQQKLNLILQCIYEVKYSSHGFVIDRSIVTNALSHTKRKARYVLNIDLKDFFPSINFGRVRGMFIGQPFGLPEEISTILANICCHDNELPQGAPSSPIISNMICSKLDTQLEELAYKFRCTYSRYADDITFSTSSVTGFPEEIVTRNSNKCIHVGHMLRTIIEENGFKINEDKVRLQDLNQRQEITGLIVNSQKPNVNRTYIRNIRAMLNAWEKYGLEAAQTEFLNKYDHKARSPWKAIPQFSHVVRGKIEFVGMVRGHTDQLYVNFLHKFKILISKENQIKNRFTPTNRAEQIDFQSTKKFLPQLGSDDSMGISATFRILIHHIDEHNYMVHILQPEEAECKATAKLPYTPDELIAILKVLPVNTLNEVKLTPVQYRLLENQQLIRNNVLISNLHETIGSRLFEALLPGELGDHIKHALTHLKNPKKAINIELQFYESDVQLVKYPWELIHYRQPLLLNGAINLTRYIKLPQLIGSSSVERLNILYIESRPKHNEFYHLPSGINNGEYNTIIKEFELLSINNGFNIQKSSPATFKELQRNLSKSDFNVIHFDGHGLIARLCPKCKNVNYPHYQHCQYNGCNTNLSHEQPLGYLAFEMDNGDDGVDWVSSKILSTLLSNSNIKLAILSACRSGEAKGNVVWGGVGPALIQAGIPAVIAMQIPITANSSMHFMQGFYSALAQGKTLGDALTEGRKTLMREPEWFVPVIYWRSKNSNYPFWITNRRENS